MPHPNPHSLTYLSDPAQFADQENRYLKVRKLEGMVLPDAMVRQFPDQLVRKPAPRLWKWRSASLRRLIQHLKDTYPNGSIRLLDLGCGNGWMTNRLAEQLSTEVWGVDINEMELKQAARLFEKPRFYFADVQDNTLPEAYFDVVVMAGSIQYFSDLKRLFAALKRVLKPGGGVHIIDTNFYPNEKLRAKAAAATVQYYTELRAPEMAGFYHHYLLKSVGGENLNGRLWIRFLQKIKVLSPFPWIRIEF